MIPFAERAQAIGRRYHLSDAIVDKLIKDGQFLKIIWIAAAAKMFIKS